MTHAFFKGLLFLGSGSVIHGLHHAFHKAGIHDVDAQDIRNMGKLRKRMPITFWTFLIGSLANAGVIPFAGFWSKDEIIGGAILRGNWVVGSLLMAAAFLTALYMFRLVYLVFYGKDNVPKEAAKVLDSERVERTMPLIWIPLILLAIPSVLIGFVGVPPETGAFHHFIEPVFEEGTLLLGGVHPEVGFTQAVILIIVISTIVAIGGIFTAYLLYRRPTGIPAALAQNLPWLYNALLNKWYFDEFYQAIVVEPARFIAYAMWRFDQKIIDGAVNGVAGLVSGLGGRLRRLQTGFVQGYALAIGVGVLLLITYLFIIMPKG
jgi:NADH-quinone oxidoreductase subunit L